MQGVRQAPRRSRRSDPMSSKQPPVPKQNQSNKGPGAAAGASRPPHKPVSTKTGK